MNIPIQIYPYTACHESNVEAHNIHLQIANLLHRLNISTRTKWNATFLHVKLNQWPRYMTKLLYPTLDFHVQVAYLLEISTESIEDKQARILKGINNNNDTASHVRHFNIPNEQLHSMIQQRLEKSLRFPEIDLKMYAHETNSTYISFPIYQIHWKNRPLFWT